MRGKPSHKARWAYTRHGKRAHYVYSIYYMNTYCGVIYEKSEDANNHHPRYAPCQKCEDLTQ